MLKAAILIDGANLYSSLRNLRAKVDFEFFVQAILGPGEMPVAVRYYTAVLEDMDTPVRKLLDWLEYHGYTIVKKMAKTYPNVNGDKIKGNMDVEIAVDMLQLACRVDKIYLVSGDGDFSYLVRSVMSRGIPVVVVSTNETAPPMISDELRRCCSTFIDLKFLDTSPGMGD